jgi:hypothetical protein
MDAITDTWMSAYASFEGVAYRLADELNLHPPAALNLIFNGPVRYVGLNWPPFRPDTWHEQGGLGISPSTGLCRTSTVASR